MDCFTHVTRSREAARQSISFLDCFTALQFAMTSTDWIASGCALRVTG
ncbi:MAG: hypothetical protein LBE71_02460 [Dysgonamonadaceae bacterium]|nr:hypothetical protein [Dysgonamonadaceae bacterium]